MTLSVAQPEGAPDETSCHTTKTSISVWANSFGTCYESRIINPEGGIPATGLFFQTKAGKVAIFTRYWPDMSAKANDTLAGSLRR